MPAQAGRRPAALTSSMTAHSSESGRTYRLDRLIGKGGFGEVDLATPTPPGPVVPAQVCVKVHDGLHAWRSGARGRAAHDWQYRRDG